MECLLIDEIVRRSDNPDKNEFPDRPLPAEELTQIRGRVAWFDNIL